MKRWICIETDDPTPAELEVLALLLRGLSNKEIAKERGRSPLTIDTQVSKLMRDTECHTRQKLVYHALEHGWVTPPARLVP